MENLFLNNDANDQQNLQIVTRNEDEVSEIPTHQHVSDDIQEELKETPSREDILEQEI